MKFIYILCVIALTAVCGNSEEISRNVEGEGVSIKICQPNAVKMKECNRCKCTANGLKWLCTRKSCPPFDSKKREKRHIIQAGTISYTYSDLNNPNFVCTPRTWFKLYCNKCWCAPDGKKILGCTQNDCSVPRRSENIPVFTHDQIFGIDSTFQCVPNRRLIIDCSSCHCQGSDIRTIACAWRRCPLQGRIKLVGAAATDVEVAVDDDEVIYTNEDIEDESFKCTPGLEFKVFCNTCVCEGSDKSSIECTENTCQPKLPEDYENLREKRQLKLDTKTYTFHEVNDPNFTCRPNHWFKLYCNRCYCKADGKTVVGCSQNKCPLPNFEDDEMREYTNDDVNNPNFQCAPNYKFKMECRSCKCDSYEKSSIYCEDECDEAPRRHHKVGGLPAVHRFNDVETVRQKNRRRKLNVDEEIIYTNEDVANEQFKCWRGREFKVFCNSCVCEGSDKSSIKCSENSCSPIDPYADEERRRKRDVNYRNEDRKIYTNEDLNNPNFRCKPNHWFKFYCNECFCQADGRTIIGCTQNVCPAPNRDTPDDDLIVYTSDEVNDASFQCAPGFNFKMECHKCACIGYTKDIYCKLIDCDEKQVQRRRRPQKKKKIYGVASSDDDHHRDEVIVIDDDENDHGKRLHVKEVKIYTNEEIDDENFECELGMEFKVFCNTCVCMGSDKSSIECTENSCLPNANETTNEVRRKRQTNDKRFYTYEDVNNPNFRCTPGAELPLKLYCNTCWCASNGKDISHCTKIGCPLAMYERKSKRDVKVKSFYTQEDVKDPDFRCKPGESLKYECNTCICETNGRELSACTAAGCTSELYRRRMSLKITRKREKFTEAQVKDGNFICSPYTSYEVDCNTCWCSNDGKHTGLCTERECDKSRSKRQAVEKVYTEAELNDPNFTCVPNSSFKVDCNTCWCSEDGTQAIACTQKGCSRKKRDVYYKTDKNMTSEEFRKDSFECAPHRSFRVDCNTCWCKNNDVRDIECSTFPCHSMEGMSKEYLMIYNIIANARKRRQAEKVYTEAELNDPNFTCVPNSSFKVDCNTCWCSEDGTQAIACTQKGCSRKKRQTEEQKVQLKVYTREEIQDESFQCTPGYEFKIDCNTCWCEDNDKSSIGCTRMMCIKRPIPINQLRIRRQVYDRQDKVDALRRKRQFNAYPDDFRTYSYAEFNDPSFQCHPGMRFMLECNTCVCRGFNKSEGVGCTYKNCAGFNAFQMSIEYANCTTFPCTGVSRSKREIENQPAQEEIKQFTEAEFNDTNFECKTKMFFKVDCKICMCLGNNKSDGVKCHEKPCDAKFQPVWKYYLQFDYHKPHNQRFDSPFYTYSKTLTYAEYASPSFQCRPGMSFKLECNMCFCGGYNKSDVACTYKNCVSVLPRIILPQYTRAELENENFTCRPNSRVKVDCNFCFCHPDGKSVVNCTVLPCPGKNSRLKREIEDQNQSNNELNSLNNFTKANRTQPRLRSRVQDDLKQFTYAEYDDPSFQCHPGMRFKLECNTCFCVGYNKSEGVGCSLLICRSAGPRRKIESEDHSRNKRHVFYKTDLNLTAEQLANETFQCKPDLSFRIDCNTCWCKDYDKRHIDCTVFPCYSIENQSKHFQRVYNIIANARKRRQAEKVYTEAELNDPNFTCVPNSSFKVDCNTCWCSEDGTQAIACTQKGCSRKKRQTEEQKVQLKVYTREEIQDESFQCTPGYEFKIDCNTCWCVNSEKSSIGCTRMMCIKRPIPINQLRIRRQVYDRQDKVDALRRKRQFDFNPYEIYSYAEFNDPRFQCYPGMRFMLECNTCVCRGFNKSQGLGCTYKNCAGFNAFQMSPEYANCTTFPCTGVSRSKREIEDQAIDENTIELNSLNNSTKANRTRTRFRFPTTRRYRQEAIKQFTEAEFNDTNFECKTEMYFRVDCKFCMCLGNNKSGGVKCQEKTCGAKYNPAWKFLLKYDYLNNRRMHEPNRTPMRTYSYAEYNDPSFQCQPGMVFTLVCNKCVCRGYNKSDGVTCTLLNCGSYTPQKTPQYAIPADTNQKIYTEAELNDANFTCTPKTVLKVDCNTCLCSEDGKQAIRCTNWSCSEDHSISKRQAAEKVYTKAELNDPNFKCIPDSTFKVDCNTCWCSEDGTQAIACTRQTCARKKRQIEEKVYTEPESNVQDQSQQVQLKVYTREEIQDEKRPTDTNEIRLKGQAFQERVHQLRRKRQYNAYPDAYLTTYSQAEFNSPIFQCYPGKRFKLECNTCVCGEYDKSKGLGCTQMYCGTGSYGTPPPIYPDYTRENPLRYTREIENQSQKVQLKVYTREEIKHESFQCTPGLKFKIDCNSCWCVNSEKSSIGCTRMMCIKPINTNQIRAKRQVISTNRQPPQEKVYTLNDLNDPNFTCTPSYSFKVDCNTCWCSADGRRPRFCTKIACNPKTYPANT